jgi:hypothetical protein
MALTKGTNSYVTVSEANAYFLSRLDADTWIGSSDINKERALITASNILDEMTWIGTISDTNQAMAFPRVANYFDDRLGVTVYLESTVPWRIAKAAMELSLHLLMNPDSLHLASTIKNVNLGAISIEEIRAPAKMPSRVKKIISPLLAGRGSNAWWRSN